MDGFQDDEDPVESTYYFTGEDGFYGSSEFDPDADTPDELSRLTFCVLITRNGFVSVGWSLTNSDFYDDHVGRVLAKNRADYRLNVRRQKEYS